MPISRSEGYRRGAGKEGPAISAAQRFLLEVAGIESELIGDPEENYRLGDLRCPSGATVEVKGQPIDPARYPKNFVEVFEDTTAGRRGHHAGGFEAVARALGLSQVALAERPVVRFDLPRRPTQRLGTLPFVSASVESIAGSAATIYCNVAGGHVYFYPSEEIIRHVRAAVTAEGFRRGMGQSNRDTHAVLVPLASLRWSRDAGGWSFAGPPSQHASASVEVRRALGMG